MFVSGVEYNKEGNDRPEGIRVQEHKNTKGQGRNIRRIMRQEEGLATRGGILTLSTWVHVHPPSIRHFVGKLGVGRQWK
jgi:hypothetical protein